MNQTMLSQLQSRIDKRRNDIRSLEHIILHEKEVLKEQEPNSFYAAMTIRAIRIYRDALKTQVQDQKLDKRLYGMALCMDDMIRYNRELTAQVYQPVYVISYDELLDTEIAFA